MSESEQDPASKGERRKAEGMAQPARRRRAKILRFQNTFLDALLTREDRTGTVDLATPDHARQLAYSDGGKWVGPAVAELRGIVGLLKDSQGRRAALLSTRPARHRSLVLAWVLVDEAAARQRITQNEQRLAALASEPEQRDLFNNP